MEPHWLKARLVAENKCHEASCHWTNCHGAKIFRASKNPKQNRNQAAKISARFFCQKNRKHRNCSAGKSVNAAPHSIFLSSPIRFVKMQKKLSHLWPTDRFRSNEPVIGRKHRTLLPDSYAATSGTYHNYHTFVFAKSPIIQ